MGVRRQPLWQTGALAWCQNKLVRVIELDGPFCKVETVKRSRKQPTGWVPLVRLQPAKTQRPGIR